MPQESESSTVDRASLGTEPLGSVQEVMDAFEKSGYLTHDVGYMVPDEATILADHAIAGRFPSELECYILHCHFLHRDDEQDPSWEEHAQLADMFDNIAEFFL